MRLTSTWIGSNTVTVSFVTEMERFYMHSRERSSFLRWCIVPVGSVPVITEIGSRAFFGDHVRRRHRTTAKNSLSAESAAEERRETRKTDWRIICLS